MKLLRPLSLTGLLLAFFFSPIQAQTSSGDVATIEIAQIDNSAYPDVTIYVRVLDSGGNRVPNLTKEMFKISEDNVSVEIVDFKSFNQSSIITMLVIDMSSSMNENGKIEGAKDAALSFIELMRPQDQSGLIVFNEDANLIIPLTIDKNLLSQEVKGLSAEGNTAWHDAIVEAAEVLGKTAGRKSIILLTDGMDNESQYSLQEATKQANQVESPVYSIGLGGRGNFDENELTNIALQTGGKFYSAPSATQLQTIYQELSESTQSEYVLTYHSPRPDYDGTRRNVVITVEEVSSTSTYVEKHLVNIQSDVIVGISCLIPLIMVLLLPIVTKTVFSNLRAPKKFRTSVANSRSCPHCQQPVRLGARYCPACGGTLPRSCSQCGNPVRLEAKFCPTCGIALAKV